MIAYSSGRAMRAVYTGRSSPRSTATPNIATAAIASGSATYAGSCRGIENSMTAPAVSAYSVYPPSM